MYEVTIWSHRWVFNEIKSSCECVHICALVCAITCTWVQGPESVLECAARSLRAFTGTWAHQSHRLVYWSLSISETKDHELIEGRVYRRFRFQREESQSVAVTGSRQAWWLELPRAHISSKKEYRETGNRTQLLEPQSLPLAAHFLQQGHTS